MKRKKWQIIVDPSKIEKGSRVTFKTKGKRVFISAFVDPRNEIVYVDTPIEDAGTQSRLIRYARTGVI